MPTGFNLGTAYASIEINGEGISKGISDAKKTIADGVKSIGSSLQDIGKNMTLVGLPFLGIATAAQNAFDEMDDAADQLGAVLKSTGGAAGVTRGEVLGLGVELQALTGITRAQIVGGENMLLTFTNIGKTVFPRATKAAVDLSVAMKQDMKSSAIQLGKALNDPITGITALTRVGVTFTESQKDMIKSMVEAGDVAGAQGIILAEIEREFGGSAAAAADPIDKLRATINDLAIDLGVSLQPVLEAIIPIISDFASRISEWLTAMTDNGDNTIGIILALGAGLAILGPIVALIGTAIAGIGSALALIFSPIGLVIAAVVGLYVAFQNNFLGIRDFLKPVFDAIAGFFANFENNVKLYGSLILLYAQYYFQGVVTAIQDIINKISEFIGKNPEFATAMLLLGAVVLGAAIVAGVLPIVLGAISTAIGLVTGAIGLLSTPALLLVLAIGAIIYAASKLYPGGLTQLFKDAATAARELAFLGMYVLARAAAWAQQKIAELLDTLNRAKGALDAIGGIGNLLTTGQITPQQLFDAIGAEIANNGGNGGATGSNAVGAVAGKIGKAGGGGVFAGVPYTVGERGAETFVPQTAGTIVPAGAGGGGMVINVQGIYANTEAGGRAAARGFAEELEDLWRGRGNG